jgi:cyclophilin family peptidyl-prolyl cis-trans isomerase
MNKLYLVLLIGLVAFNLVKSEHHEDEDRENVKYVVTNEVYFDISVKESKDGAVLKSGRVVIGLFGDICPMTVTNFVQLAKGFKRDNRKYSYKNSPIHRIVKDFVIQTGDILEHDGTGSKSIYGDKFIDENFILSHRSAGWVSMANYGSDTNGSQFFITLVPARWLDGHHVVFGRILSGMSFVRELGELETYKGSTNPKNYVEISESGIKDIHKYELSEDQLDSPGDIRFD